MVLCEKGHIKLTPKRCNCDIVPMPGNENHCCACFIETCGGAGFPPTPQPGWNEMIKKYWPEVATQEPPPTTPEET